MSVHTNSTCEQVLRLAECGGLRHRIASSCGRSGPSVPTSFANNPQEGAVPQPWANSSAEQLVWAGRGIWVCLGGL